MDAQSDEAYIEFPGQVADGLAYGPFEDVNIGIGRDGGFDCLANSAYGLGFGGQRDGLNDRELRAGSLADAKGER